MRIEQIDTHPTFEKHYKRLSKRIKNAAKAKEIIFRENPHYSVLKTHKLHGQEKDVWSFSVIHAYRIKFIFIDAQSVLFLDIGTHDIYR